VGLEWNRRLLPFYQKLFSWICYPVDIVITNSPKAWNMLEGKMKPYCGVKLGGIENRESQSNRIILNIDLGKEVVEIYSNFFFPQVHKYLQPLFNA